jgi:Sec-independent protein translocase protein TatA
MGGLHLFDTIVIVGIALLLFGPKTLQSLSHKAGKGVAQAKEVKNQLLAELPVEELQKMNAAVSSIPLTPQAMVQKVVTAALPSEEKREKVAQGEELAKAAQEAEIQKAKARAESEQEIQTTKSEQGDAPTTEGKPVSEEKSV